MTLRILATKPLVHLASIALSVSLAVVGASSFQTTVQAKPAPTTQGVSSERPLLPVPGNLGAPRGRSSGATRGGGNNSDDDIEPSTAGGEEVKATAPTDTSAPEQVTKRGGGENDADRRVAAWGWTKIDCSPTAVVITGMGADTVCVNPTSGVAAGHYTYDRASNKLIPLNSPSQVRQSPSPVRQSPPQNTEPPKGRIF